MMNIQLTTAEIDRLRETLPDYEPAQKALATLKAEDGNIETSFETLWREKNGAPPQMGNRSLWQVTIQELRKEICGEDDSFRTKIKEYSKNPGSAPLLTGLIVYLVGIAALPLDPAIATVIVLYILKVGLNIFCEYTKSEP
jgi:hypothetical protein